MSFKNLLVVKNISLHYNVATAKSSFCQLIDSFEAKCFAQGKGKKIFLNFLSVSVSVDIKGERIVLNTEPFFFQQPRGAELCGT